MNVQTTREAHTSVNSRTRVLNSLKGLPQVDGEVLPEVQGDVPTREEFLLEAERIAVFGAQRARRLDTLGKGACGEALAARRTPLTASAERARRMVHRSR